MRYLGKQGCASCHFCVPTLVAAGYEMTRALDTQVCLRLSRGEGSWFSSTACSSTQCQGSSDRISPDPQGRDHCRMLYFSISNCPPYRPLRNSTAVEGLKWLLKGQTLEANRLNLTLTLPFIHCFDMSTLVKLSNIFL